MRTKMNKEQFFNNVQTKINHRNALSDFYTNVFLPTAKKFDGKVYNIRFIKALKEQAEKISDCIWVRELSGEYIEVHYRMDRFSYSDYECAYYPLRLNADGRISFEETTKKGFDAERFSKTTKEYQDSLDNYDKYMEVADRLADVVKEYNSLPFQFRYNVDASLHIY